MDNNFFDERANRFYENQFRTKNRIRLFFNEVIYGIILILVIDIVLLITFRNSDNFVNNIKYLTFINIPIFIIIIVFCSRTCIFAKWKRSLDDELQIISGLEDKQEVYDYINNCIANNEILFRHKSYPEKMDIEEYENNEVILLPKYLLHCKLLVVEVIYIEYVLKVFVENRKCQKPSITILRNPYNELLTDTKEILPTVCIQCNNKKEVQIVCETIEEAESIVSEMKKYLPSYNNFDISES